MKKFLFSALSALSLFVVGCKEDFEVAAPYKNVIIVYGMLDMDSTTNYVRIQKAFLDAEKSAFDMSKVSDSNFYPDGVLDVKMRVINITTSHIDSSVNMTRVQVADKESGAFFTTPNYAYKLNLKLDKNKKYRLVIKNTITGDVDSSETAIVNSDTTYGGGGTSGNFYVYDFDDQIRHIPPTPVVFSKMASENFKYELSLIAPLNASVLEGFIRFFYWEKNTSAGTEVRKSLDYPFDRTKIINANATLSIRNYKLYAFFADKLGTAPANVLRYLDSCDIFIYAGTKDFEDYADMTALQSGVNLTSNEIKPLYSNIKGKDAYGLFTSRAIRWGKNIGIDGNTIDSLFLNPRTRPTGLQPDPADK